MVNIEDLLRSDEQHEVIRRAEDTKKGKAGKDTLDEKPAIGAVLSDMDAEIAALKDKVAKAREVKQGIMQVLLTREIRLT